jgi:hypothetical protein
MNTIKLESSWGILETNLKGEVLKVDGDKEIRGDKNYLYNIKRVDLEEYKNFLVSIGYTKEVMGDWLDILFVGFWGKDGSYNSVDTEMRRDMHIVND